MMWDGVGFACKIDGRMDAELYTQILKADLLNSLEYSTMARPQKMTFFSKTMTPSTLLICGSKTIR